MVYNVIPTRRVKTLKTNWYVCRRFIKAHRYHGNEHLVSLLNDFHLTRCTSLYSVGENFHQGQLMDINCIVE